VNQVGIDDYSANKEKKRNKKLHLRRGTRLGKRRRILKGDTLRLERLKSTEKRSFVRRFQYRRGGKEGKETSMLESVCQKNKKRVSPRCREANRGSQKR